MPGICMPISSAECCAARQHAVLVAPNNFAASFDLFYEKCLFLSVNQRTREAFLLLHSSWFKQARFRFSLTARIVWKDLGDKQEFACRAQESVHAKQPKIQGAWCCVCQLSDLSCVQPGTRVELASKGENASTFSKPKI